MFVCRGIILIQDIRIFTCLCDMECEISISEKHGGEKQTINEPFQVKDLGCVNDGQRLVDVCSFLDL